MPESEQITHTALAIQIAEVKGSLNTIATLLPRSLKSHNELVEEFFELAQRCHLPAAFITAFPQAIIPPGNSE